jgi:putative endonuclease
MNYYYVYIMASKKEGTLYIGVTNNLVRRVYEHKSGTIDGFSKKYKTDLLVYYEMFGDIYEAIIREKRLKKWKRNWKIKLIKEKNPNWNDLYGELIK